MPDLQTCGPCGNAIDSETAFCPKCGAPGPGATAAQRAQWKGRQTTSSSSEKAIAETASSVRMIAVLLIIAFAVGVGYFLVHRSDQQANANVCAMEWKGYDLNPTGPTPACPRP